MPYLMSHHITTAIYIVDKISEHLLCVFSKATHELLMLVYEVLEEAVQSTDFCSIRLFCTARNIFELYGAVVTTHHQKLLETIPQQVGEFHAHATKVNTTVSLSN
jgi:hypothetical protein